MKKEAPWEPERYVAFINGPRMKRLKRFMSYLHCAESGCHNYLSANAACIMGDGIVGGSGIWSALGWVKRAYVCKCRFVVLDMEDRRTQSTNLLCIVGIPADNTTQIASAG